MKQRCPVCAKPSHPEHKPFCSRGCKDRDLLRWMDDGYRIPGPAADPDLPDMGPVSGVDNARDAD